MFLSRVSKTYFLLQVWSNDGPFWIHTNFPNCSAQFLFTCISAFASVIFHLFHGVLYTELWPWAPTALHNFINIFLYTFIRLSWLKFLYDYALLYDLSPGLFVPAHFSLHLSTPSPLIFLPLYSSNRPIPRQPKSPYTYKSTFPIYTPLFLSRFWVNYWPWPKSGGWQWIEPIQCNNSCYPKPKPNSLSLPSSSVLKRPRPNIPSMSKSTPICPTLPSGVAVQP